MIQHLWALVEGHMERSSSVTMVMRHCLLAIWCYLESHKQSGDIWLDLWDYTDWKGVQWSACTYCVIEFMCIDNAIQWEIAEFRRGEYSEEIKTCYHGDGTAAITGHNRPLLLWTWNTVHSGEAPQSLLVLILVYIGLLMHSCGVCSGVLVVVIGKGD